MASSSAATAPPDVDASGTSGDVDSPEIDSPFLHFKFRMAMVHKMIKKLLQETSVGGDTPEIRDLKAEAATLANKFNALVFEISEVGNRFILNFMNRNPRQTIIALEGLEKGNLEALILEFEGFSKKIMKIEGVIRSFIQKCCGVSENYASILYIRVRSVIHKEHLKTRSRFLQFVEEKEEMERLKGEFEARKAKLEEFGRRLGKLGKEYLLSEMAGLGEETGGVLKARSAVHWTENDEICDLQRRLRQVERAMCLSGYQYLRLKAIGEKIGQFDTMFNEIGDMVFMTSFGLDEAKKKQNPADFGDGNFSGAKED